MSTVSGVSIDELADALWPRNDSNGEYHTRAPVESTNGSTVYVLLRGSEQTTPCSKLTSCLPKAGDLALVLMTPSGGIVLGTIG